MNISKKILSNLSKCYSIAPLKLNDEEYFLVAAEKTDRCILFDMQGNEVDTVWEEPGGVMSMVQVPGSNGQFLATHKFYSPNDSKDAEIVTVTFEDGNWKRETLVKLPHVHRFDIVERSGIRYLIACTIKSGHEYKDDWSCPGKVYAAVLPDNLSKFHSEHQLELTVIKDGMLKNHGYYRVVDEGIETCIIAADCGVYQFIPPVKAEEKWEIHTLLNTAGSDAVLIDLDNDGEKELAVLSPFHGETISIYKKKHGTFERIYQYDKPAEFAHAIYGGNLLGQACLVVGHRKGEQNILWFTYSDIEKTYKVEVMDHGCGAANVYHFESEDADILISTNREIDEVAMYTITK